MRMIVLLLSRIEAVIRPGAQPLLHCARSILFAVSWSTALLFDCLRNLFSSRSHLQKLCHCCSNTCTMHQSAPRLQQVVAAGFSVPSHKCHTRGQVAKAHAALQEIECRPVCARLSMAVLQDGTQHYLSTSCSNLPCCSSGISLAGLNSCIWPPAKYMMWLGQNSSPSKMWVACNDKWINHAHVLQACLRVHHLARGR